jgi:hypothetical protein
MTARIRAARALLVILKALAIAWAFLVVGESFGWSWVREAGGLAVDGLL